MAYIHFEVDDELHRTIKAMAAERGETIREVGGRLFRWYVNGADLALLELYESAADALAMQYQTDDGWYMPMDEAIYLSRAVADVKSAGIRRQQGGEEE